MDDSVLNLIASTCQSMLAIAPCRFQVFTERTMAEDACAVPIRILCLFPPRVPRPDVACAQRLILWGGAAINANEYVFPLSFTVLVGNVKLRRWHLGDCRVKNARAWRSFRGVG